MWMIWNILTQPIWFTHVRVCVFVFFYFLFLLKCLYFIFVCFLCGPNKKVCQLHAMIKS